MVAKHAAEPWKCFDRSITESEVTIIDSEGYERLNSEKGCQTEWAAANFPRIVACVNFCRQFDTEFLRARQLMKITGKDETTEVLTADKIPGFEGFVAAVLVPVSKETGSEVDVFSDG